MELTSQKLAEMKQTFFSNPTNRLAMNAATRVEIQELAINRHIMENVNFSFSNELESAAEATSQKKVGICWMYAGFNWCREIALKKLNVENLEFAGPYLVFWDKLEKANYFLHKMVEFINLPLDERIVWLFLKEPHADGGWWHEYGNLIKKYGLIPKFAMPDTKYTEDSTKMNQILSYKLRGFAAELRGLYKSGYTVAQLKQKCNEYLNEIYRILAISLGTPPDRFDWSYRDKNKNFYRFNNMTPLEFYEHCVGINPDDMCQLWHCPMSSTPYHQPYTIEHVENMLQGRAPLAINLPINELKKYASKMLLHNEPCLFSCDVAQESQRKEGILYKNLYDYGLVFQTKFDTMDKATRLEYGEGKVSHAMVFTGVDLQDGKINKWKVLNSWGNEVGKKGYFIMSDEWFEEYVYEVIIPKKLVDTSILELLQKKPTTLPFWHPIV